MTEEYFAQILRQCQRFCAEIQIQDMAVEPNDVAAEMAMLVWLGHKNHNGLSKVTEKSKLIPRWQLRLIFLNALRNLKILPTNYQKKQGQPSIPPFFSDVDNCEEDNTKKLKDCAKKMIRKHRKGQLCLFLYSDKEDGR